jgi:predicted phosphohydrolase
MVMALFTISDLHLSLSADKSMTVFRGWENYTERIKNNWQRLVKEDDTVVLPGDFSWGLKLSETLEDFKFLDSLPGKKILLKGNHDLWWSTVKKVNEFFSENNIKSVELLFNNAFKIGDRVICGTRGWFYDQSEDDKIRKREVGRLLLSFDAAEKLGGEKLVFLHYPPVYGDYISNDIISVLEDFNVTTVYHGHIHGSGFNNAVSEFEGIKFKLISADCIDFTPFLIV